MAIFGPGSVHKFAPGYADVTPHTHDWNFWSMCLQVALTKDLFPCAPLCFIRDSLYK
jgi:hypothetical protein